MGRRPTLCSVVFAAVTRPKDCRNERQKHPHAMSQSLAKILVHTVVSTKDRRPLLRAPSAARRTPALPRRNVSQPRSSRSSLAESKTTCIYYAHCRAHNAPPFFDFGGGVAIMVR